jgi:hypothetical protein
MMYQTHATKSPPLYFPCLCWACQNFTRLLNQGHMFSALTRKSIIIRSMGERVLEQETCLRFGCQLTGFSINQSLLFPSLVKFY